MANLADQLSQVKLKKVTEPIKDFSSPKTAGFLTEAEIANYEDSVLEVNTEVWLEALSELTFPSEFCPLHLEEARVFVSVFERLYKDMDPSGIADKDWKGKLTEAERELVKCMTERLQGVMDKVTGGQGFTFVKTSCRSAKDAPMAQQRFGSLYQSFLQAEPAERRLEENTKITCLLKAAFSAMKTQTADEVLDMMLRSERIYQDMLLALKHEDRFQENFVVRKFVFIDVDMEFRGFINGGRLRALSQYNYAIFSERLVQRKQEIQDLICKFFAEQVLPKLPPNFTTNFIMDFAICNEGTEQRVWVIEINPFLETTDGALFSWQHEKEILENSPELIFRVTEQPRPGATAMLPQSMKTLLRSSAASSAP